MSTINGDGENINNTISGDFAIEGVLNGNSAVFTSDVLVEGDLEVTGSIISELKVEDPLIQTGLSNPADLLNLGYYSHYTDGVEKFAGLIRNKDDKEFYLLNNEINEPSAISSITNKNGKLNLNTINAENILSKNGNIISRKPTPSLPAELNFENELGSLVWKTGLTTGGNSNYYIENGTGISLEIDETTNEITIPENLTLGDYTLTNLDGNSGQLLSTDGLGTVNWVDPAVSGVQRIGNTSTDKICRWDGIDTDTIKTSNVTITDTHEMSGISKITTTNLDVQNIDSGGLPIVMSIGILAPSEINIGRVGIPVDIVGNVKLNGVLFGDVVTKDVGTGIGDVPEIGSILSANSIVETDVTGKLIVDNKETAYNKSFGVNIGDVPEIGLALSNNNVVETDLTGKLVSKAKGTAHNKDFGTGSGQVMEGNTDIPDVLSDLSDIVVATPVNNQVLTYSGGSWINQTLNVDKALGDLTNVDIDTPAQGNGLVYNAGLGLWQNAVLPIPNQSVDTTSDVEFNTVKTNEIDGTEKIYIGDYVAPTPIAVPSNINWNDNGFYAGFVNFALPTAGTADFRTISTNSGKLVYSQETFKPTDITVDGGYIELDLTMTIISGNPTFALGISTAETYGVPVYTNSISVGRNIGDYSFFSGGSWYRDGAIIGSGSQWRSPGGVVKPLTIRLTRNTVSDYVVSMTSVNPATSNNMMSLLPEHLNRVFKFTVGDATSGSAVIDVVSNSFTGVNFNPSTPAPNGTFWTFAKEEPIAGESNMKLQNTAEKSIFCVDHTNNTFNINGLLINECAELTTPKITIAGVEFPSILDVQNANSNDFLVYDGVGKVSYTDLFQRKLEEQVSKDNASLVNFQPDYQIYFDTWSFYQQKGAYTNITFNFNSTVSTFEPIAMERSLITSQGFKLDDIQTGGYVEWTFALTDIVSSDYGFGFTQNQDTIVQGAGTMMAVGDQFIASGGAVFVNGVNTGPATPNFTQPNDRTIRCRMVKTSPTLGTCTIYTKDGGLPEVALSVNLTTTDTSSPIFPMGGAFFGGTSSSYTLGIGGLKFVDWTPTGNQVYKWSLGVDPVGTDDFFIKDSTGTDVLKIEDITNEITINNKLIMPRSSLLEENIIELQGYIAPGATRNLTWDYGTASATITEITPTKLSMVSSGAQRQAHTNEQIVLTDLEITGWVECLMQWGNLSGLIISYGIWTPHSTYWLNANGSVIKLINGGSSSTLSSGATPTFNNTVTKNLRVRVTRDDATNYTLSWRVESPLGGGEVDITPSTTITFDDPSETYFSFLAIDNNPTTSTADVELLEFNSYLYAWTSNKSWTIGESANSNNFEIRDSAGTDVLEIEDFTNKITLNGMVETSKGVCIHKSNFGYGCCVESTKFFGYNAPAVLNTNLEIAIMTLHNSTSGDVNIPPNFSQIGHIYDINIKGLLKTGMNDDTVKFRVYMGNNTLVAESEGTFSLKRDLIEYRYWEIKLQCICMADTATAHKYLVSGLFTFNHKITGNNNLIEGDGITPIDVTGVEVAEDITHPINVTYQYTTAQPATEMLVLSSRITFSGFQ